MFLNPRSPIGVFDSGVGGISVLKHLRSALPAEHFLYVADSGHAPYGIRDAAFIVARAIAIGDFLLARGAKALVVACNTATAAAVDELRSRFSVPVIAMEPAIKPAVEISRSKIVGVLATAGTLESARFFSLLNRYGGDAEIITQPCFGLVEAIEANDLASAQTKHLLQGYLQPLLVRGADTIVLGCTHYPFLREQIAVLAGDDIALIDTGAAVARELRRRLEQHALLNPESDSGTDVFWSSGECEKARRFIARHWHAAAQVQALP